MSKFCLSDDSGRFGVSGMCRVKDDYTIRDDSMCRGNVETIRGDDSQRRFRKKYMSRSRERDDSQSVLKPVFYL